MQIDKKTQGRILDKLIDLLGYQQDELARMEGSEKRFYVASDRRTKKRQIATTDKLIERLGVMP